MIKLAANLLIIIYFIMPFHSLFAAPQTIEAQGICIVGDDPNVTIKIAKERAKEAAIKVALDKAGVYIESYSKTKNLSLNKNEINVITGEILKTENISYSLETIQDNILQCTAFVRVIIETDGLYDVLSKEKDKIKVLAEKNDFIMQEYLNLKDENKSLYNPMELKLFSLYKKVMDEENVEKKISLCNEILSINSSYRNGIIYGVLGTAYSQMKKYDKALECDLKYLSFNSDNAYAYYACAMDYYFLNNFIEAYTNIYTATVFDPQNNEYKYYMRHIIKRLDQSMDKGR